MQKKKTLGPAHRLFPPCGRFVPIVPAAAVAAPAPDAAAPAENDRCRKLKNVAIFNWMGFVNFVCRLFLVCRNWKRWFLELTLGLAQAGTSQGKQAASCRGCSRLGLVQQGVIFLVWGAHERGHLQWRGGPSRAGGQGQRSTRPPAARGLSSAAQGRRAPA